MQRDIDALRDMLACAYRIQRYIENHTFESFCDDWQAQDSVTRRLEIMGEATTRISEEFKQRYSEIPWRKMKSMRNILIHMYDECDESLIWKAAAKAVPEI